MLLLPMDKGGEELSEAEDGVETKRLYLQMQILYG